MKKEYPDILKLEGEKWHNPDPATGKLGTRVPAEWLQTTEDSLKSLTLEMLEVLKAAGINPNELNNTQIRDAIQKIIFNNATSTLSDRTDQTATIKVVNDVNRAANNAQTSANNANNKANAAQTRADSAHSLATSANNNANTRLEKSKNLSDLTNVATARSNLGLKSSATLDATSTLSDRTDQVATIKVVNDVNRDVVTAQNTANKKRDLTDLEFQGQVVIDNAPGIAFRIKKKGETTFELDTRSLVPEFWYYDENGSRTRNSLPSESGRLAIISESAALGNLEWTEWVESNLTSGSDRGGLNYAYSHSSAFAKVPVNSVVCQSELRANSGVSRSARIAYRRIIRTGN